MQKSIFPLFRGSGGQIKFLIEKNTWGKIFGRLAFYTQVEGGGLVVCQSFTFSPK